MGEGKGEDSGSRSLRTHPTLPPLTISCSACKIQPGKPGRFQKKNQNHPQKTLRCRGSRSLFSRDRGDPKSPQIPPKIPFAAPTVPGSGERPRNRLFPTQKHRTRPKNGTEVPGTLPKSPKIPPKRPRREKWEKRRWPFKSSPGGGGRVHFNPKKPQKWDFTAQSKARRF